MSDYKGHTTPGPWIIKRRNDGLVNLYDGSGVHDVALCMKPQDADLVVDLLRERDELRAMVEEFLVDAETMNEPYRNEAICERARTLLARTGVGS